MLNWRSSRRELRSSDDVARIDGYHERSAGESLTSFPLGDENYSDDETEEKLLTEKKIERRKLDPLHGVNLKSHGGKCCWVDTGEHLFLDVHELLAWLQGSVEL